MYRLIIITADQRDALLERAEIYDFGVNRLAIIEVVDGTWCLSYDTFTNGEFDELKEDLEAQGLLEGLHVVDANEVEFVEYDDDGNRTN